MLERRTAPVVKRSRFGSFLYVVVTALAGTFFVACAFFADTAQSWGREGRWVAGFLYVYALSLAGGFAIQIAAAFLLRWLTRATGADGLIHWMVFGAALGIALPWACARLGYLVEGIRFAYEWQNVKSALMFPLMAAMMYETHPAWVRLAVGAATGGTVRLVFGRPRRPPG
jgi:hypothetical protein